MVFDSFDTIFYTFAFVAPGFIFYEVMSSLVPTKDEKTERLLLKCLILSLVNYALWSWLIYLVGYSAFFTERPVVTALAWTIIVLGSPTILALVLAKLGQKKIISRLLVRMGFFPIDPIPTAWDWKFSKAEETWVLLTLA